MNDADFQHQAFRRMAVASCLSCRGPAVLFDFGRMLGCENGHSFYRYPKPETLHDAIRRVVYGLPKDVPA